jgi:hypothetical protein
MNAFITRDESRIVNALAPVFMRLTMTLRMWRTHGDDGRDCAVVQPLASAGTFQPRFPGSK